MASGASASAGRMGAMSQPYAGQPAAPAQPEPPEQEPRVIVVGPDGMALEGPPAADAGQDGTQDGADERSVTQLVEQPAKVMRIGSMIKQLLEEVQGRAAGRGEPAPG